MWSLTTILEWKKFVCKMIQFDTYDSTFLQTKSFNKFQKVLGVIRFYLINNKLFDHSEVNGPINSYQVLLKVSLHASGPR